MFNLQNVAQLARLRLSPEQEKILEPQLKEILEYVNTLQKADSTATPSANPPSELPTVFRDDVAVVSGTREERVDLAANSRDGLFLVPKVLGGGEA